MSRIGTSLCFAGAAVLAACGTSTTGADNNNQPDGGAIACEEASDCPADQLCADGVCVAEPADELRASIEDSVILDERGDEIDFDSGGPVHTHAGEPITLGATGCPAVFKYSYLLDPQAPLLGAETAPNPLAWRFAATGATVAQADYRVRTATATKLDWTPATADAAGGFTVKVFRSGPQGIAELQAVTQQYFIDFRVRDELSREATVTGCWEHNPLAPPVLVTPLVNPSDLDSLAKFTLAANSPVSRLVTQSQGVKTFAARISHATAEPVTVKFEIPIPSGSFSKTVVTDLVPESTTASVECGNACVPSSPFCVPEAADDPRCATVTPIDPTDATVTGALLDGNWTVKVLDLQTNQAASECAISGRTVTCALAARQAGSKELVVQLFASRHTELAPASGTIGELTFQGLTYTGLDVNATEKKFRCDNLLIDAADEDGFRRRHCTRFTTFHRLIALDQLRVTFAAPKLSVQTAIPGNGALPGTELAAPPHIPAGLVTGVGFLWDSGNDDLPGVQH